MSSLFVPSFLHFQKDIERCLEQEGKCEKNEHGQLVYRGYPDALDRMFRAYLEHESFPPLVAEFRRWNWEWSYNDYLWDLTARLKTGDNWPLLKELWAGVVAKRRTNYNKTRKARQAVPDKVSDELVTKTKDLLLDSLYRLRSFATELQKESDAEEYVEMIARVEKLRSA